MNEIYQRRWPRAPLASSGWERIPRRAPPAGRETRAMTPRGPRPCRDTGIPDRRKERPRQAGPHPLNQLEGSCQGIPRCPASSYSPDVGPGAALAGGAQPSPGGSLSRMIISRRLADDPVSGPRPWAACATQGVGSPQAGLGLRAGRRGRSRRGLRPRARSRPWRRPTWRAKSRFQRRKSMSWPP